MSPPDDHKVVQAWQTSAQYWEKYRPLISKMFGPLTSALVGEARISSGQSVLDVGGGSGEPSLTLARIVGPKGQVMYSDPASAMVRAAHAEALKLGMTNIGFCQCGAQALPFADSSFDSAVGRLSAMFFPDPIRAVCELLRVVVPGGYVSFVVWARSEINPFFCTLTQVMDRFVESPPIDPDAPGAFRFATPGKLAQVLADAGAEDVTERVLQFKIEAPLSPKQFWQLRTEMSDTLREKVAKLAPEQLSVVKEAVQNNARQYFEAGTMSFPAYALVVTGRRSGQDQDGTRGDDQW